MLISTAAAEGGSSSSVIQCWYCFIVSESCPILTSCLWGVSKSILMAKTKLIRSSKVQLANSDVTQNLKELLAFYSEGPRQVLQHCATASTVINCSSLLGSIAEHFNLIVSKEIWCTASYAWILSAPANNTAFLCILSWLIRESTFSPLNTHSECWVIKPDDKTLDDIQVSYEKTFHSNLAWIVVKEGSVTVICYAPTTSWPLWQML